MQSCLDRHADRVRELDSLVAVPRATPGAQPSVCGFVRCCRYGAVGVEGVDSPARQVLPLDTSAAIVNLPAEAEILGQHEQTGTIDDESFIVLPLHRYDARDFVTRIGRSTRFQDTNGAFHLRTNVPTELPGP
ncbi:hypothetical protein D3C87_1792170 [compost metagenome]